MRILKTIGIVISGWLIAIVLGTVVALGGNDPEASAGQGIAYLAFFAYWGFLATKVNFRWWDFLFALIPFYGIFWMFRIAHRVALLPNKDWLKNAPAGAQFVDGDSNGIN